MPAQNNEKLADDLLKSAEEIAEYTGLTVRQVYHQSENLGLRRLGAMPHWLRKLRQLLIGEAA
jgi:hypothetical protein